MNPTQIKGTRSPTKIIFLISPFLSFNMRCIAYSHCEHASFLLARSKVKFALHYLLFLQSPPLRLMKRPTVGPAPQQVTARAHTSPGLRRDSAPHRFAHLHSGRLHTLIDRRDPPTGAPR